MTFPIIYIIVKTNKIVKEKMQNELKFQRKKSEFERNDF